MNKLLLEKLKGYKSISLYDGDTNKPKRNNSKKAKLFEQFIIKNNFPYKKIIEILKNKEQKISFCIKQNEKIDEFLEQFETVEIKDIPEDMIFNHPYTRKQKDDYNSRGEIYVECFDMPEEINGWKIKSSCTYYKGNKIATITDNSIIIDSCVPVGRTIYKSNIKSIQEKQ